jgi:hypothetical protein
MWLLEVLTLLCSLFVMRMEIYSSERYSDSYQFYIHCTDVIFGRVQEQVVTHLLQVCNSSHILFLGLGMFVFCQNDYAL